MASTRHFVFVALVVALAAVAVQSTPYVKYNPYAAANKSHHLVVGQRQAGDALVYQENIYKPSSWLQTVELIKTFNVTGNFAITQVLALDQKTDGNGAYAYLLGGGPAASAVKLRFKSQRSHGIKFIVQLYAKRRY